jgi:hypothetical protein
MGDDSIRGNRPFFAGWTCDSTGQSAQRQALSGAGKNKLKSVKKRFFLQAGMGY